MKKITIILLALVLNSCNDGRFNVPSFNFTTTVNSCGTYVLYITNTDKTEVLSLILSSNEINQTAGTKTYTISNILPVNYRILDSAIGTSYFCQSIPPSSPNVLKDLNATSGQINITTTAIISNSVITGYTYQISFINLLFNDGTSKIFYETFNFGTFTSTI